MKSPITIDFVNATITVNAAYAKKASNPFSAEYAQIQKVRADYPTFTVRTRSITRIFTPLFFVRLVQDVFQSVHNGICFSLGLENEPREESS